MISVSPAFRDAIVGVYRRIRVKASIDIEDPDMIIGTSASSGEASYSVIEEIHDKELEIAKDYITLELNRWLLNGGFVSFPGNTPSWEIGYVSNAMSGEDGEFSSPPWVELRFSGVSIIQACSIIFSNKLYDGLPVSFKIDIKSQGTVYYTQTFNDNSLSQVAIDGFTVANPDAIRVTVYSWSLPYRHMRVPEIIPGIYEVWDSSKIVSLSATHQGDISCLSIPYGICTLELDNTTKRFDPNNRTGLFQSITERQGIEVAIGVDTENGTEYVPLGVFYQHKSGWKTSNNGMSISWPLTDIVGLLSERSYFIPDTLPTTLGGWIQSLVSQLGSSFQDKWHCDPSLVSLSCTADRSSLAGKSCGQILQFICMATGTWPRADANTGDLTVATLWSQGNQITLDNLSKFPEISSNEDIAAIRFTLSNGTEYIVSGNQPSADRTISISNPFIHTTQQAQIAAREILETAGGSKIAITGRGDPSSEIGDVDTVQMNSSLAKTGRRINQAFQYQNGILVDCTATLIQPDGDFMFQNRVLLVQSTTWVVPTGVTSIRLILIGHGEDGGSGETGTFDGSGANGEDGKGGKVWTDTVSVTPGQSFAVVIDTANTAFGSYSSVNGQVYPYGYSDISNGDSFARTGVKDPIDGSGDGGKGGKGGQRGVRIWDEQTEAWRILSNPSAGSQGVSGKPGCVVIYYNRGV